MGKWYKNFTKLNTKNVTNQLDVIVHLWGMSDATKQSSKVQDKCQSRKHMILISKENKNVHNTTLCMPQCTLRLKCNQNCNHKGNFSNHIKWIEKDGTELHHPHFIL